MTARWWQFPGIPSSGAVPGLQRALHGASSGVLPGLNAGNCTLPARCQVKRGRLKTNLQGRQRWSWETAPPFLPIASGP